MKSQVTPPKVNPNPRLRANADPIFFTACKLAQVPPSRRQWSKWTADKGLARSFKAQAESEIGGTK